MNRSRCPGEKRDASTESDSSAAERLRWRNHPPIVSPSQERENPFDGLQLQLEKTAEEKEMGGSSENKDGDGVDGIDGDHGVGAEGHEVEREQLTFRERIRCV